MRKAILSIAFLLVCFNSLIAKESTPSKGVGNNFFKSLLIPGWGQLEQGRTKTGYAFIASELLLISSAVGLSEYGQWLKNDYQSYASTHGGLRNHSVRSHSFYVDMGNWNTTAEYNQERARERQFGRMYTSFDDQWSWLDEGKRLRFKSIRQQSDRVLESVKFAIGGVIINHVVSAIDATRPQLKQRKFTTNLSIESIDDVSMYGIQFQW